MPFKDIFCVPTPTPSCGSPACRCINSPVWVICREREFSTDTQVAIDKHDSGEYTQLLCSRGRGVCTTTAEEACAIGMLYKADRTLWLSFMGCLKNCANVQNIKWSVYFVTFKCCRGYDLCNDDL
ncbi:prostate and testis expressed protein 1-like isoform X5 [Dipodomys merriami]|uniref:prostate and testis expressed protein 1-like isoform X5 n=1 Tax=Dipodomys merriami TaxID=94247 RepID=UPI003855B7CB